MQCINVNWTFVHTPAKEGKQRVLFATFFVFLQGDIQQFCKIIFRIRGFNIKVSFLYPLFQEIMRWLVDFYPAVFFPFMTCFFGCFMF